MIILSLLIISCGGSGGGGASSDDIVIPPNVPLPGITVHPEVRLVTTEAGGTGSFTVVLDTQPSSDVIIDLSCSDLNEGMLDLSSLTFTSGDWDTPQTVTVDGVDDALVDGIQAYIILTARAVSTDPGYNGINPVDVSIINIDDEASVSAGSSFTAAIKTDGTLWTWGQNGYGRLGDGTTTNRSSPIQIGTDNDWASVSAGGSHIVALKTDGTLWLLGKNGPEQLGTENDWSIVAAGSDHKVALKTDGTLWAWGQNGYGRLGDGTTDSKSTPAHIGTDNDWSFVAAGIFHSFALKTDGSLWAWGRNIYGHLGDGTFIQRNTPTQVEAGTYWSIVAAGGSHTVGVMTDGSLWAWGSNTAGQFGDGTTNSKNVPTRIGIDTDWAFVDAGGLHTIGVKTDGSLWTWGRNVYGQLGDGTTIDKDTLTRIQIDLDLGFVSAGINHTVMTDGTFWAWGENRFGQLGDGTTANKDTPIRIGTDVDWVHAKTLAIGGVNHLSFSSINTGVSPPDQTITILGDEISWTASSNESWVQLESPNGAAPCTLSVGVDPSLLTSGIHTAAVTFTDSSNGDTVILSIELHIEPHKLFVADNGIAFSSMPGVSRLTRSVTVNENAGISTPWTAVSSQSWLTVTPGGDTGDDLLLIADPDSLSSDTIHYATVAVSSSDVTIENSEVIRVGFWVGSTGPNAHDILSLDYTEITADPIRPYVYMHNGGTDIDVYNVHTANYATTISNVGTQLLDMEVSTDGSTLFVADPVNTDIVPVDLDTYAVGTAWDASGADWLAYGRVDNKDLVFTSNGVVFDVDTGTALPNNFTSSIGTVNVSQNGEKLGILTGFYPARFKCYRMDYSELGDGKLTMLSLGSVDTGGSVPYDIALTQDGTLAYVASGNLDDFLGFDLETMSQVQTLPAGGRPNNAEVNEDDLLYGGAASRTGPLDVWIYDRTGVLQNSYYLSEAVNYIRDRQLVVSGDGVRMIVSTDDPTIQMLTAP